jgi:hypothetical protein
MPSISDRSFITGTGTGLTPARSKSYPRNRPGERGESRPTAGERKRHREEETEPETGRGEQRVKVEREEEERRGEERRG